MDQSATGPAPPSPEALRRDNALQLVFLFCFGFAVCLRLFVSPFLMNMVVDYTNETGAFYEKLHFGTYAIFLLLPVALLSKPITLRGDDIARFRTLLRYFGLMLGFIAYLILTGRAGSSGFVIDTYLVAGAAGLIMLSLPPPQRRMIGGLVVTMLTASAVLATLEAVTRIRIMPYTGGELQFRPVGLSEHPLTLGALCATAIAFAALTRWPIWLRVATVMLLLIGNAASGARLSLLLALGELLILLVFLPWPGLTPRGERRAKLGVTLLALVGGIAIGAVLVSGGLLSRFEGTLFDENYMARITIYRIFEFVTPSEILFGKNLTDVVAIVNKELQLPYIESAQVFLTFLFGLPLAIVFAIVVFRLIYVLLRRAPLAAWVGTSVFFLAVLSNNMLATKTPVVTIIVLLLLGFVGTTRAPTDGRG